MQVVVALYNEPLRFSELRRVVVGISQQMLTRTLKALERDGLVDRKVYATNPPQVEYSLTARGVSLSQPVRALAEWAIAHRDSIRESHQAYDRENETTG